MIFFETNHREVYLFVSNFLRLLIKIQILNKRFEKARLACTAFNFDYLKNIYIFKYW